MTNANTTTRPIVTIRTGQVQGVRTDTLAVFKGIPYAAPPVGDRRWREPQPVAPWEGVLQAETFSPACPQPTAEMLEGAGSVGATSEDCLYLNVWTPNPDSEALLPVMVWIHGGALKLGAGSQALYDGGPLAQRGAVVVTLNYRLGPLGFFAHPALEAAAPGGPVNFGLLDQIAALRWVQDNINAFGGDPGNVTIFGESAGGQSVLAHFASPLSRGLFHRGIAQSAYGIPSHPRAKAVAAGSLLAGGAGLDGDQATAADLRAVPAEMLVALNVPEAGLAPSFVVGDAALPKSILETFQAGEESPLPLIMGSNSDEATVALSFGIDPAALVNRLRVAKIALKVLYPGVKDDADLGRQVIRDLIFTALTRRLTVLHAERASSWRYYFSYVPLSQRDTQPGAAHGGEVPFVFGTADRFPSIAETFSPADHAMAERVGDYWFSFAQSGRPNPTGQPEWPATDARNDVTLEFGDDIVAQRNFMKPRVDVFIGLLNILGKFLDRD